MHLLAVLDQVDLEGFIFQNAWVPFNKGNEIKVVDEAMNAYGKVWNNLSVHSSGSPTEKELRKRFIHGQEEAGMKGVGEGLDSPGSEFIIKAVDKPDERPVWITTWAGINTLAQALWKVRNTRSTDDLERFVK